MSLPCEKLQIPDIYEPTAFRAFSDHLHAETDLLYDAATDLYCVVKYDDNRNILKTTPGFEGISNDNTLAPLTPQLLLMLNPGIWPAYAYLRKVPEATANANGDTHLNVKHALFTPASESYNLSLDPGRTEQVFGELITDRTIKAVKQLGQLLLANNTVDFAESFARPLISDIISTIVGFSPEEAEQVRRWSDAQTTILGRRLNFSEQFKSIRGLRDLSQACYRLALRRAETPKHDLTSHLLSNGLTPELTAATTMNIIAAGYSTTYGTVLNSLYRLLSDPTRTHWNVLAAPDICGYILDDLLRQETALPTWKRRATEDITLSGGSVIPKGKQIALLLGVANRDPEKFIDPHTIMTTKRKDAPTPLTFGAGAHMCVGRELARLELTVILRALQEKLPNLSLVSEHIEYEPDYLFRTPKALPVRLG